MHEYHLILKGTKYEQQAEEFRKRVQDVSVFLDRLGDLSRSRIPGARCASPITTPVTWPTRKAYDPSPAVCCEIPRVEIQEVTDGHLCCGSAGTYNIDHPELAHGAGDRRRRPISWIPIRTSLPVAILAALRSWRCTSRRKIGPCRCTTRCRCCGTLTPTAFKPCALSQLDFRVWHAQSPSDGRGRVATRQSLFRAIPPRPSLRLWDVPPKRITPSQPTS